MQFINGFEIRIVRNRTSQELAAVIRRPNSDASYRVPEGICELAAGKDEWHRQIEFPCAVCNQPTKAVDLSAGLCAPCLSEAEAENERLDRGEAIAGVNDRCRSCGQHPCAPGCEGC